ncbi:unnamed protein product, partial [Schistosoma mattheei]
EYTDSRYPANVQLKCLWENCTYIANRLRNLSSHLDTHTQAKRAACPTCGLLLVDFPLERHILFRHSNEKPFKCPYCNFTFKLTNCLTRHLSSRHKIYESNENDKKSTDPVVPDTTQSDLVGEKWPHSISIAPIHGPLAQAGALPNVQADISTPTDNDTTPCAIVDVFVCPHNGCNFKTNKRNGYLVHIGRKHHPLPSNSSPESSSDRPYSTDNSPNTSQERLYKCHMCSVVKRRDLVFPVLSCYLGVMVGFAYHDNSTELH